MQHAPHHPAADPTVMGMFKWSVMFHSALAMAVVAGVWVQHQGDLWGSDSGPGGSVVPIGMVQKLPGIPLPTPQIQTESRVVDESKGLYKDEPKPKVQPPPDATPIEKFEKEKPPKYQTRPSRVLEDKTPPPTNAIPYGGGGGPTIPNSTAQNAFQLSGNTMGSLSVPGAGGTGDFGSRYGWYVDAVRNRISSNWLQSLIDPSIRYAPRVVVTFTILRNGTITNIQFTQRSGYTAVDNSALRALQASSPFQALPGDYSGQSINVEFWFDFKR